MADDGVNFSLSSIDALLMKAGSSYYDVQSGLPYNPANPALRGADYSLTGTDGTVYRLDTTSGVEEIITPAGKRLWYTGNGITSESGDAIRFTRDDRNRITRITSPDGAWLVYAYDDLGDLSLVRNLETTQGARYGYDPVQAHLLTTALLSQGSSQQIQYGAPVSLNPISGDLGSAFVFSGRAEAVPIPAGQSKLYAFTVRSSELASTPTGTAFIKLSLLPAQGSSLQPRVPTISGLAPLATAQNAAEATALFAINRPGVYVLAVAGADANTSGEALLEINVAGDIDGNGKVDGVDAQLLSAAMGKSQTQPDYLRAADLNGDGTIDSADNQILVKDYGFFPNLPPVVNSQAPILLTHTDLELTASLADLMSDWEGDRLFYQIAGVSHGTAHIGIDGASVIFLPETGYAGAATFQFSADDGFASTAMTVTINVSNAPLTRLDFRDRTPRLLRGQAIVLEVMGDFADQNDVLLPGSYLNFLSTNPSSAAISADGRLVALDDGTGAILVSSHGLQAATAFAVGVPADTIQQFLYAVGFKVYPTAVTLANAGATRQLKLSLNDQLDLTTSSNGTIYFVSDTRVASVTPDGLVTALGTGNAAVTIINGPAETVVAIRVEAPQMGAAMLGSEGGAVQGADGSLVMVPPGALAEKSVVSITPVSQADLPIAVPGSLAFEGGFQLELGDKIAAGPVQLAIPASPGTPAGTEVYFLRAGTFPDENGVEQTMWFVVDNGFVGSDGIARTSSPPYPGVSESGKYLVARATVQLKTVTIRPNYYIPDLLLMARQGGTSWGFGAAFTIIGGLVLPMAIGPNEFTFYKFQRGTPNQPVRQDLQINVRPEANTVTVDLPIPSGDLDPETPFISQTAFQIEDGRPFVTLSGANFTADTAQATRVVFRMGATDHIVNSGNFETYTENTAKLAVPSGVILGLSQIFVARPVLVLNAISPGGQQQTEFEYRWSNPARIDSRGSLGYAARGDSTIIVFDPAKQATDPDRTPIVKTLDVLSPARANTSTADGTRVYVATTKGIAVIDALALQMVDVNPATPELDVISLPKGAGALSIDPKDHFLYVARDGPIVYVIDINPASKDFHTVVAGIPLPSAPSDELRGIAVNSDGRRLYVAAPGTTLYGGWYSGERVEGMILVVNIDPADRPEKPEDGNPKKWREEIKAFRVGYEPFEIVATSDPKKIAFSDFLDFSNGLGTLTVTNDSPLGFSATIRMVGTRLGSFSPTGYELNVHNARGIALMPDLSYAFVADWYQPGFPNQVGGNIEVLFSTERQRGAKIGIVEDPFGPNPRMVAATTPIPMAFADSLALSPNSDRLYVSFRGAGEILVFNVDAIRVVLTNASNAEKLQTMPVDTAFPNINLAPLTTNGLPQGLTIQQTNFLQLISPVTGQAPVEQLTPTFTWKIIGPVTVKTTEVFVSVFPPDQGLFPPEKVPFKDLNPGRIVNGVNVGDETSYVLSSDRMLTAGQTYYWGVKAVSTNNRISWRWTSFKTAPSKTNSPFSSVTVLTHGFQADASWSPSGQFIGDINWVHQLADFISRAGGGGAVKVYDKSTGTFGGPGPDPIPGKPLVLILDWYKESDISDSGFSEAAADAFFAALVQLNFEQNGNVFGSPLHFIGHSRGTVVNSEIIQRLGTYFPGVRDIQMTTLDPHDGVQPSLDIPLGLFLRGAATLTLGLQPILGDISVLLAMFLKGVDVINPIETIYYGDFHDPDVQRWPNILFADNYYQTNGAPVVTFTPNGRPFNDADIDIELNGRAGFTRDDFRLSKLDFGLGGPHSRVWQWYAGTTNFSASQFPAGKNLIFRRMGDKDFQPYVFGFPTLHKYNDVPWYHASEMTTSSAYSVTEGIGAGWFYSPQGGGPRTSTFIGPLVDVDYNNTEYDSAATPRGPAVPSVFNGDFESGTMHLDSRFPWFSGEIPGWSFHGGGGTLTTPIASLDKEKLLNADELILNADERRHYVLQLDVFQQYITHNRVYIPPGSQYVTFDLLIRHTSPGGDGLVNVFVEDASDTSGASGVLIGSIALGEKTENFERVPLLLPPDVAGQVKKVRFQLVQGGPIQGGDVVWLDNVAFTSTSESSGQPVVVPLLPRVATSLIVAGNSVGAVENGATVGANAGGKMEGTDCLEFSIRALAEVSRRQWAGAGLSGQELSKLDYVVFQASDLPGYLGITQFSITGTPLVTINRDPSGYDWFIDAIPLDASEFTNPVNRARFDAVPSTLVFGKMDLLTVITHELGHVLGLADLDPAKYPNSIMASELAPGVRKLARAPDLLGLRTDSAIASITPPLRVAAETPHAALVNGDFSVSNPADVGFGWSTRGDATVVNGAGELGENGKLLSGFSQVFSLPVGITSLSFTIAREDLIGDANGPGDAFEAALLDAGSKQPLLGPATGLPNTDALLNIQSDGTTWFAPGVKVSGVQNSGGKLSLGGAITVQVDLSGIAPGTAVTVDFDLLGFSGRGSLVSIDNVRLNSPDDTVQTPVADAGTDISTLEGEAVVLHGTYTSFASGDPSFNWRVIGPAGTLIVESPTQELSFTPADDGLYVATFTVSDANGSASDQAAITAENVQPTLTLTGPGEVSEGSLYTLQLAANDPGSDTINTWTIGWGDGAPETVNGNPASVTHTYADGSNVYTVTASATDEDGTYEAGNTLALTVNNVPPVLTLTGPSEVNEGSIYALELAASDPGTDTISTWTIDWGDGAPETVNGNPASVTHTYADGPSQYTVSVQAIDEDGTYDTGNTIAVRVKNVPPTLTLTGPAEVNEGSIYTLQLAASDPGTDTISSWTIGWGDGATDQVDGNPNSVTHTYADGPNQYTIRAQATDEDGTYDAGNTVQVSVKNVAPTVAADVATQTVQYSDPLAKTVTFTATDPADPMSASVSYSLNGGAFVGGLPDASSIDGGLTFTGASQTSPATWTLSGVADLKPGTWVIRVTVNDGDGGASYADTSIQVQPEDARSSYAGPMFVSTPSIKETTATVELRAVIRDITAVTPDGDPNPGNITTATVTFVNRDANNAVIAASVRVSLLNPADPKTGVAVYTWQVDLKNSDSESFAIGIVVNGNYHRDSSDDDTVLTVSKPLDKFITGGGYLVNENQAGTFAGDAGLKTNFGFNVKFNNNLTSLQGKFTAIVRQNGHVYRIKTNAIESLVVNAATDTATLVSKANLTDVTDPNNPVSITGNLKLILTLTDNGEPGSADSIGFTLWNGTELWLSSDWTGSSTAEQVLDGGNLVVHAGKP